MRPGDSIVEASTREEMGLAGSLFREYALGLEASARVSLVHQGFEAEVSGLPGRYARPEGCILLAWSGGEAVGCVALRGIASRAGDWGRVCEMKRMYVRPTARGRGLGRALAERLIAEARGMGYGMMKLDTEPALVEAVALYRAIGFVPIERYNDDPVACTMYFGLRL